MKQLTIKELLPYVPYNVKVQAISLDGVFDVTDILTLKKLYVYGASRFIPILRPLSDLTKKEFRIKLKELGYRTDEDGISDIISDIQLMYANYEIMVFCFENHIDVFNLIPQNLAIDINTL